MCAWFKRWRHRKDEERLKNLCEARLRQMVQEREERENELPSATSQFEAIGELVAKATEEKKKARSAVQKLLDLLPSFEKEKKK